MSLHYNKFKTTNTQAEEQVNYNTNTLLMEALYPWYKCCSFFNKVTDAISVLTYKYIVYFKSMKFLTIKANIHHRFCQTPCTISMI